MISGGLLEAPLYPLKPGVSRGPGPSAPCNSTTVRHRISELSRPIAVKLCHVINIGVDCIMQFQQFWGPPLKMARFFYTTSGFDREYLRNETRYPKSERHVIESDSSRVQRNKSGELWSTIHKVVHGSLDPPKSTSGE